MSTTSGKSGNSVKSDSSPVWAVGLMTGTVLDGNIDVALLKTDGETVAEFGVYSLQPYDSGVVERIQQTLLLAREWNFQGPEPALFAATEEELTRQQAQAVSNLLREHAIAVHEIAVVGFHGQSILHQPPHQPAHPPQPTKSPSSTQLSAQQQVTGRTRQLGDGQLMANLLGIPVAWDFRSADMAAGGQGAPLAPVYHRALLSNALNIAGSAPGEVAVLNLGGIGNLTWWGGSDHLVAFDTGPANAPINDWVSQRGYGRMDIDGKLAAAGVVDEERLAKLLEHPYLSQPYPKSLDRFDFTATAADGLSINDGAALLTAFSAAAVGRALELLPPRPQCLIISGGGRHNPTLVKNIAQRGNVKTLLAEDVGWRGDATEAECFAFLAVRVMRGLPLSFPSTTGVRQPCIGGMLSYPAQSN